MSWETIRDGKLETNLVPVFPSTAPVSVASLANLCWDVSPSRRWETRVFLGVVDMASRTCCVFGFNVLKFKVKNTGCFVSVLTGTVRSRGIASGDL